MKDFETWNDNMFKVYAKDHRYVHPNYFIRFNTLRRLNSILKALKPSYKDDILEIGCGSGYILKSINAYNSMTGIDLSDTALNDARRLLADKKNVQLIKGDAQDLKLANKYDKIICAEVLEHLPDPRKVIEEIVKVSKETSVIIITIPNEKNIERVEKILHLFSHKHVKMDWHIHKFNLNLLRSMLGGRLVIKRVIPTPFFFFPFSYTVICEVKK